MLHPVLLKERQETKLKCPECDKEYERPQGLGIHRRTVHGVVGAHRKPHFKSGTQRETCPECGITVTAKYLNYTHLPRVHGIKSAGKVVAVSKELVPVNHKQPKSEFRRVESFIILEDDKGGIWLAEQVR
jgi:endogenous inhibitor of DNA gyrase (YacG/DUF329 family)